MQLSERDTRISELEAAVSDWKAEEKRVRQQRDDAKVKIMELTHQLCKLGNALRAASSTITTTLGGNVAPVSADDQKAFDAIRSNVLEDQAITLDRQLAIIYAMKPIIEAVADSGYWDGSYHTSRQTVDAARAVLSAMEAKG